MKRATLVKLTAELLSHLLHQQKISIRKNSSKTVKIKALLCCDDVKENCTEFEIQRMEEAVQKMEEQRNKKSQQQAEDAEEEEIEESHEAEAGVNLAYNRARTIKW